MADEHGHRAATTETPPPRPGELPTHPVADDFVVLVTGEEEHAQALRQQVATVLAPMGLRLSPEKTRVVHIDDGFDFLGFTIRPMRKRGSQKRYVYTRPSTKAIASIKDRSRP